MSSLEQVSIDAAGFTWPSPAELYVAGVALPILASETILPDGRLVRVLFDPAAPVAPDASFTVSFADGAFDLNSDDHTANR